MANLMQDKKKQILALVALGIFLLVLPFLAGLLGQAWVRILNVTLLYVMLALGLNVVVGVAGLLDLGYVAFYAVGAYTCHYWRRSTLICTCRSTCCFRWVHSSRRWRD